MPRLVDGKPLTARSFTQQWTQLAGVASLLSCAQRTGVRVGIWGGCVRNFVLDDRVIFDGDQSLHLMDFVDPFSDVDCVLDRAGDWPITIQSISASVAFAGFVRWEYQTREEVLSSADQYARIGAESFIVWHEGFDADRQPKISVEPIKGHLDPLFETPALRVEASDRGRKDFRESPWQEVFDALRMTRYVLQYPTEEGLERRPVFPDIRRKQNLPEFPEAQLWQSKVSLRFDLALLDLAMTAHSLPEALSYISGLSDYVPSILLERSDIFASFREMSALALPFIGGLVYHQRNSPGLRIRVLTERENSLWHGGIESIIPWTPLWSVGTGAEDCCRHEDFKNGIAVVSWRAQNLNITYTREQAQHFAPVAQVARDTLPSEPYQKITPSFEGLWSVPGIARVGPSMTLRFDHAYLAQLMRRTVQAVVGVVNPENLS